MDVATLRYFKALSALIAIRSLVNGEFDNPELLKHGPLHPDMRVDINEIIEEAIGDRKKTD